MADIEYLKKKIEDEGIKTSFLARKIGITLQGFNYKLTGKRPFKLSEIAELRKALRLSDKETIDIFLS